MGVIIQPTVPRRHYSHGSERCQEQRERCDFRGKLETFQNVGVQTRIVSPRGGALTQYVLSFYTSLLCSEPSAVTCCAARQSSRTCRWGRPASPTSRSCGRARARARAGITVRARVSVRAGVGEGEGASGGDDGGEGRWVCGCTGARHGPNRQGQG